MGLEMTTHSCPALSKKDNFGSVIPSKSLLLYVDNVPMYCHEKSSNETIFVKSTLFSYTKSRKLPYSGLPIGAREWTGYNYVTLKKHCHVG